MTTGYEGFDDKIIGEEHAALKVGPPTTVLNTLQRREVDAHNQLG